MIDPYNLIFFAPKIYTDLIRNLVIVRDVNIDNIIPRINICANPAREPDPTNKRTKAAIRVVIFPSTIALKAF